LGGFKVKKVIYPCIGILLLFFIYKSGFVDSKFVKVDDLKIVRPLFFQIVAKDGNDIVLSNESNTYFFSFVNSFSKKSISYSIKKEINNCQVSPRCSTSLKA
jgi:hypothetical protein